MRNSENSRRQKFQRRENLNYICFLYHLWFKPASAIKPSVTPFFNFPCFPPSAHHLSLLACIAHVQTHTHTQTYMQRHTYRLIPHKDPPLCPPWQEPHISTSKWGRFFCGAVTKSSHSGLVRVNRNRLREEVKLKTENERKSVTEMSPTLPCSFWTSCTVPTEWHRSHIQL